MEEVYTTNQIIEVVKSDNKAKDRINIEEMQRIAQEVEENRSLLEALAEIKKPRERGEFIRNYVTKAKKLTQSERRILEDNVIQIKIELGEYESANQQLRRKLTKKTLEDIDYYYLDSLVLTERKLGHIKQAKELAIAMIEANPGHVVAPRNELIRIAMLEGNREEARAQIEIQMAFYDEKRESKTMEYKTYETYEEETKMLEAELNGDGGNQKC